MTGDKSIMVTAGNTSLRSPSLKIKIPIDTQFCTRSNKLQGNKQCIKDWKDIGIEKLRITPFFTISARYHCPLAEVVIHYRDGLESAFLGGFTTDKRGIYLCFHTCKINSKINTTHKFMFTVSLVTCGRNIITTGSSRSWKSIPGPTVAPRTREPTIVCFLLE